MKCRPIPFTGAMVRALLAGEKMQTRRIIRDAPDQATKLRFDRGYLQSFLGDMLGIPETSDDAWQAVIGEHGCETLVRCPYGVIGDRLWVREEWRVGAWFEDDDTICVDYRADGHCRSEIIDVPPEQFSRLWVQSTGDACRALGEMERYQWKKGESPCRWRTPRFMSRWASRLTLEITDVRVERLQAISEADAYAEGIAGRCLNCRTASNAAECGCADPCPLPRDEYLALWESINGAGSWDANPWVWALTFRRIID